MNLVTVTQPTSAAAEAYRALRTNVHFASLDAPLKTILITPAEPGPSAAAVVANLGVSLAQTGKRALLVDANLREPSLHALFDLVNNAGLVAGLIGAPGEPHIQPTAVEGLSVLAAGTDGEHATDALSSERMQRVVTDLAQRADVVLFLAPAVTVYSDAAVLASRVDGALLVVNAGKTRRDSAEKAKTILTRAHARVIGAVMLGGR